MSTLQTQLGDKLSVRTLASVADLQAWRERVDVLAIEKQPSRRYLVGFASSTRAIERALRLRFDIFNRELGEGLFESEALGLDMDRFDPQMSHLVVLDRETDAVIGTYRLQTMAHALNNEGVYSGQEYDLTALEPYFHSATECGRACIAKNHRNANVLLALWKGIREFMRLHDQRWLFGCCSLTSTDPDDGWRAMKTIRRKGFLLPEISLPARPDYSCGSPAREFDPDLGAAIELPKLFAIYMRLGSKVVSEPAIDREFGTVDFLILMDAYSVKLSTLDFFL